MDISHMIETITPITLFNKGKASQLFAKATSGKPLLVVKNNAPVAVILSKDEYCCLYQLAHACEQAIESMPESERQIIGRLLTELKAAGKGDQGDALYDS